MATKTNTSINGQNYFRIRRIIDGKQKSFYGKSKGDAEKKYREYLEEQARLKFQEDVRLDTATFGDRAEEYVNHVLAVSRKYASGTIDRYTGAYNTHIKGASICKMRMRDIKAADMQKFYNGLDVSQQTMKTIHKFMSAFFKWLVLNNYSDNILAAVEIPKKKDNSRFDEIVVWEDAEIQTILSALDAPERCPQRFRLAFMVKVLLYTGMRISEVLGLRYKDIKNGVVSVERQWYLSELKEPKWNSKRKIPIHEELVAALEDHKAWHEEEMRRNGYKTDFIFTTNTGKLYSASSVRKSLMKLCEKNGIEYKHIHAYRATFCTQMCKCGVPLEVTSKLMGHKSLEVTAAHYALVKEDSMADAIGKLKF